MEWRSLLVIAWILILTLTSCQGQFFEVKKGKVRTTPPPGAPTFKVTGKVWDGVGPKPSVPGIIEDIRKAGMVTELGAACDFRVGKRGAYFDRDTDLPSYFYPWADYVGNCDIARFLRCETFQCKCFPGYYWNSDNVSDGRCVAGFQQNCSTFIGYDFRITPICGDGMECIKVNDDFSRCVCFQNQANLVYPALPGPFETDAVGSQKHYCARRTPVAFGGPCNEYRGQQWVGTPGSYTLANLTLTDCNDLPGSPKVPNLYCKFPGSQTGTPGPGQNFTYGSRTNGTCTCTDPTLDFNERAGMNGSCLPKPGSFCTNNTVTFKGWDFTAKQTIEKMESDCGVNAICVSQGQFPNRTMRRSICMCATDSQSGERYQEIKGFCHENQTLSNIGQGKNIGDNCTVGFDPCWQAGNQECVNFTCVCKKGFEAGEGKVGPDLSAPPKLLCRGLYGIKCTTVDDCAENSGFLCTEVPELKQLNESAVNGQQFCVCEDHYLNTRTGKCGAMTLTPTHFGLVLYVLLYLGVYFDSSDWIIK